MDCEIRLANLMANSYSAQYYSAQYPNVYDRSAKRATTVEKKPQKSKIEILEEEIIGIKNRLDGKEPVKQFDKTP